MSKNQIQRGDNLTLAAPAAVKSGDPVQIGAINGVALTDAASGASFDLATTGVFRLPKVAADAIETGDKLYISATGLMTDTADSDPVFGIAVEDAAATTGTVAVRIAAF